ncbi:hypothetical protein LX36DRAFT_365568 [Colletotrichum falcatum]|nr:hypothetical protein LX36DRAFT_365568 [Colletotrichum falcatum]
MKASIFSSLIIALAGVLVTATPTSSAANQCLLACRAQCKAEGKIGSSHVECDGATATVCDCVL